MEPGSEYEGEREYIKKTQENFMKIKVFKGLRSQGAHKLEPK